MIDNFWIFVTQLCSVLVYIGIVFGLYKLLAAQKDATIQAKEATIENLQVQLQQIESKIPDTLVTLLKDRLEVSQEELERLKHDKDKSSSKIRSLKERQEITSETVINLLSTIRIFRFLSKPANEDYKDFVLAVCGNIEVGVSAILASENLTDLASEQGKMINEVNNDDAVGAMLKAREEDTLVISRVSKASCYVLLKDNTIKIDNATLAKLTQKHKEILGDLK